APAAGEARRRRRHRRRRQPAPRHERQHRRAPRLPPRLMRFNSHDIIGWLRRHKTAVGALTGTVAGLIAIVAALSTNGLPFLSGYELETTLPAGAPTLRKGVE